MDRISELKPLLSQVMGQDLSQTEILPTHRLREDVGLNSIGLLYMALAMENHYHIRFDNKDITRLTTVADVLAVLTEKLG